MCQQTKTQITDYLLQSVRNGNIYFKSKSIAKELNLSAKQVGQYIRMIQEDNTQLSVEKYANTKSTTWMITA